MLQVKYLIADSRKKRVIYRDKKYANVLVNLSLITVRACIDVTLFYSKRFALKINIPIDKI